jgi:cytochrome b
MRMNGSDSRRSRRVCNSRNDGAARKRRSVGLAGYVGLALVLLFGGCGTSNWTLFEYVNESPSVMEVVIEGITPRVAPTNWRPGDGTTPLLASTARTADPVHIAETVRIIWSVDGSDEKHVAEFKRAELGVGERVRGGTFRFVYHGGEKWTVDYDPRATE